MLDYAAIRKQVKAIGKDSWELLHFGELPKKPSVKAMLDALKLDRRWLEDHCNEVCHEIDRLCCEIEARGGA
jgi:hypothetical protein